MNRQEKNDATDYVDEKMIDIKKLIEYGRKRGITEGKQKFRLEMPINYPGSVKMRVKKLIAVWAVALAVAATALSSCDKDEPVPPVVPPTPEPPVVTVDTAFVSIAGAGDILPKFDEIKTALDAGKPVRLNLGNIAVNASDIKALADNIAKFTQNGSFAANWSQGSIQPVQQGVMLSLANYNAMGNPALAAGPKGEKFYATASDRDSGGFGLYTDKTEPLTRVNSIQYGTDGAELKKLAEQGIDPDTVIHDKNFADAQGLLCLQGYKGKKIIIRTVLDASLVGGQVSWQGMNNPVMDLFETPSAPDFEGSGINVVYKFENDPILTEYVTDSEPRKFKPLNVGTVLNDTLAGNQSFIKIRASNRQIGTSPLENRHQRPVIISEGPVDIVPPQTPEYKNHGEIYVGGGGPLQEPYFLLADSRICWSIDGLMNYPLELYARLWGKAAENENYNDIEFVIKDASKILFFAGMFSYFQVFYIGSKELDGARIWTRKAIEDDYYIKIDESQTLLIEVTSDSDFALDKLQAANRKMR